MIDYKLSGKNALVTGGSHGIGLATALALARLGCNVAICSRSVDRLHSAEALIRAHGVKVLAVQADALDPSSCDEAMQQIEVLWGGCDLLINNVGGGGRWGGDIVQTADMSIWADVYQKNAGAAIQFTMWAIPYMMKKGWGRVITVTSMYGKEGGGRPWFNMAKAAEVSLMKSLSLMPYLVRSGITFNTVAPGGIYINGTGAEEEMKNNPVAFKQNINSNYPLGRMGTPEEVSNVICFLGSELSSLVNGAQITVDGGQTHAF